MADVVPEALAVNGSGGEQISVLEEKELFVENNFLYQEKLLAAGYNENIGAILSSALDPIGLDVHPFMIGWYNKKVGAKFRLEYPEDTLAFVIISGPDVFEKCIVPYVTCQLQENPDFRTEDPLDDSMKHVFGVVKEDLQIAGFEVDTFHDFDLHPSRRPKVLVQTAAHVAGAVQYLHKTYLPEKIQRERFFEKSNLSGVAIHPTYGGWYAIRGVVIFRDLPVYEQKLEQPQDLQIFNNPETIARVIELFAYNWQNNEWRNMHPGSGFKYSDDFQKYLDTEPAQRWNFVKNYCLNHVNLQQTCH
ncbi:Methylmalonic aciduria and homocystinuria type C protein [Orchesella cincta]|uniref:Cyanocobalamin reductase (cyanide-eliminating) n=1 Tax=Orchesella cincta TaxID=48709 RepID=A0A1D2MN29_ORCCI|nr:Methylmalonic aciduria and homocystinuria type C protein [Orchesella cincta]